MPIKESDGSGGLVLVLLEMFVAVLFLPPTQMWLKSSKS